MIDVIRYAVAIKEIKEQTARGNKNREGFAVLVGGAWDQV